ncbi:MAG TPA: CotH kinase family protein [Bryobacteraceae bacterium]|nr:CotH kinase family protein [Bryobacteraceae bacterium]
MSGAPRGLLLASLLAATLSPGFAQTPEDSFFDDTAVQAISLTMEPGDWAALQRNVVENTYYHADFAWNGMALRNIGVRSHGGVSRLPTKPNLDLNFAKYEKAQRFLGLPFVLIKANNRDPSNLREWLSFQLFRKMGFPAPREAPARVLLNGRLLGFYIIVEHVDEHFLERNFGESRGRLYKWRNRSNYEFDDLGDGASNYEPMLELKSKEAAGDWRDFANLIQSIHRPFGPDFSAATFIRSLSRYLDPGRFLAYLATENVLSDGDGIAGGLVGMNNFYLYQGRGGTEYRIIPWDKDLTFSGLERDVLEGITRGRNVNLLAKRLVGIPEWQTAYLRALAESATLLGGTGGWADREITRETGVIHDAAANDPNKWCFDHACGTAEFESDVRWLHAYLSERARNVLAGGARAGFRVDQAP